ncbi:TatD family hydrolase [Desmospora profundinema]|uniref:TatD DNase family protein n=1 Tax=Desmospora profundinema TaxID=1571184 RepID=A0ABU1IMD7_9BACL|nr:TatD family hydrolase [Desmospora profundinema]MDR6225950.1 TatD DNase family protein [Desmospora profundinema]
MNTIRLVDTHCHWDRLPPEQMEEIVRRAKRSGVTKVLAMATDAESCLRLLQWKQRYPDFLEIAFGLHPEQEWQWNEVDLVIQLIREHRHVIRAVGEVGLPYYSLPESMRLQNPNQEEIAMLERFLRVAVELDLPVSLHAVHHRAEVVLRLLRREGVRKAVFHWLKAPERVVGEIVGAGYGISVTPDVCHRERDRRLVENVPLSSLLLETDAPWSYGGAWLGQPSEPAAVQRVAEAVSQLKGVSLARVATETTIHAERLFGIRVE